PTLLIDDESDQASVNTVNPKKIIAKKDGGGSRSRINEHIVEILKLLPRAQYIGYTATPFANVFVNPNDPEDLYPKDFLLSLPRPPGYMGAREFLDFEVPRTGLTNTDAYIREIPKKAENGKTDTSDDRLVEAIDAFVLTGALKKFREKKQGEFKHHTMLVHHSVRTADQKLLVRRVRKLWNAAGYSSPGPAAQRLQGLFENDFRKVWLDRGKSVGFRFPKTYAELRPYLGEALDEIGRESSPVLMVNSAEGGQAPDFDGPQGVWKIIVGGAKLSRGYTIEGLTISYFRRASKMQDTLMQMGRWFGYRSGHSDLVRLYIGRAEGRPPLDLLEAFDRMCRDEEDFRDQLKMYEGKGGLTPRDVPALVFNSHPRLRPTSRNKMFNHKVVWAAFDYREPTSQSATKKGRTHNANLFEKFISTLEIREMEVSTSSPKPATFKTKWADVSQVKMVSLLTAVEWDVPENPIEAALNFLREKKPVDKWLFLAPQIGRGNALPWNVKKHKFKCVERKVASSTRFGVFSSPEHLNFAKWLIGWPDLQCHSPLEPCERTGILLFYPTRERDSKQEAPVMGFGIVLPRTVGEKRIAFSV
ncbi:MAG: Z1 domain-containing protein, partial [Chthoniobacterales bacterium]|nr:Z1 domain-containing protein [Chthoniobacterales bacterium]